MKYLIIITVLLFSCQKVEPIQGLGTKDTIPTPINNATVAFSFTKEVRDILESRCITGLEYWINPYGCHELECYEGLGNKTIANYMPNVYTKYSTVVPMDCDYDFFPFKKFSFTGDYSMYYITIKDHQTKRVLFNTGTSVRKNECVVKVFGASLLRNVNNCY